MREHRILRKCTMNKQKQASVFDITGKIKIKTVIKSVAISLLIIVLASCRGQKTQKSPIHPNLNMDQQPRFEAQESNPFFADSSSMRQPVEGTVPRGYLKEDRALYEGMNPDGSFVEENPIELTRSFMYRGKEQYEIYCTVCHGKTGTGNGIIMSDQYTYVPAPSYHQERIRNMPDGQLYDAIASGVRTMPSYAHQVDVEDRWAIVAYIRALQRSQNVPEEQMASYDVDLSDLKASYQEQQEAQKKQEEAEATGAEEEISVQRGKQIYTEQGCPACHSTDGSEGLGPTHQNIFGRQETLTDGTTITVDEEYIRESIVDPNANIVEGYQPVMQPYSHLSDSEIQSIIEYMKSISENQ